MRSLHEIIESQLESSHPMLLDTSFDDMESIEFPSYELEEEF